MSNINYFTHSAGIWSIFQFLQEYLNHGYKYEIENHALIELSSFYSQHIGIGGSNDKKKAKNIYILFSKQFYDSLELMSITNIYIDNKNNRLYLKFNEMSGDGNSWPTISSFFLSFYYEHNEKINLIKNDSMVDLKEYWFLDNDEDQLIVDHTKKIPVKVKFFGEFESIHDHLPEEIDDYLLMIDNKLNNNVEKYSQYIDQAPVFQGTYEETDIHKELRKKGLL